MNGYKKNLYIYHQSQYTTKMPSESKGTYRRDDDDDVSDAKRVGANESDAKTDRPPTIVDRVIAFFFENEDFCRVFERFADKHCDIFDVKSDEMQLEYTDIYKKFTDLFESKIEAFIESQGSTVDDFYTLVKKAHDKDPHGTIAIYSRMLVATTDFDVFVIMMKQAKEAKAADAKGEFK
ncbi:hypothetical protein H310_05697 [Aphanomyces invadans]|uniref:Cilia- and flagella-associated protein 36 n=1 Tax=Aphanomyces invadans TaxID=157072 RepID=A0A024U863_9STRA|nr:hypothetical protein H310_05697 [Aphanomyces invadans]ETW02092.1 hypothetical protein H310_05697 [Aphanomyces invadans]RHY35028.1 hypothetical protein DYB32_000443 [Aphanomyces invadans]|eukprot:XP_008868697.1 hypothetical protein H310_05697 [Aphanomyces invadans]